MNTKPDENTLISYLYGELTEVESKEILKYLMQHPEEQEHVRQLQDVLTTMSRLKDKEVIAPSFVGEESRIKPPTLRSLWNSASVRTVMSIAASFLLILVVGKFLGTEVNYSSGELRISFTPHKINSKEAMEQQIPLSTNQIQSMINSSLAQNNDALQATLSAHQLEIDKSVKNNLVFNSRKIDSYMKTASQASQDQVRTFVSGLQNENLRLMKDYLQLSSSEQQKYMENLLVDFSKYLQEQRNQDFKLFQTRMTNIEKNTDQFKQETEQILTSLISNRISKKQNSY